MRVLVTGGCGFIGSHFVRRLVAAGEDLVVLDKLTYSGRKENLDGVEAELLVGDIADPEAVAAAAGCDAIVNFAAETHVDRSILGATDFGRTEFFGTQVLAGGSAAHGRATSRCPRTRSTATWRREASRGRPTPSARRAPTASPRPRATCTFPRTSAPST